MHRALCQRGQNSRRDCLLRPAQLALYLRPDDSIPTAAVQTPGRLVDAQPRPPAASLAPPSGTRCGGG